eukprot:TRINITY_DN25448_c0_g1_i1.p1 TRINITY_DN25448_c0_g1~~TRINITY_DN25448_c0_g1_i1.p1  ORF type:complete len:462 (-),score=110.84 TRINITY_DN25448_c0_g1_i1:50-1435(-)
MPNFQLGISDAKFLYDLQDQSDNYCLLSSLLNFEESPMKDNEVVPENVTDNMEWLDLVDYKEEPNYDDDRSNPEKESERKRKHNQIEKARRLFIDAKIRELGFLLPKTNEAYHELAKDIKYNKGGILKAAVSYLRILKSDQIKKQKLEEKCRIQDLQKRKLMMKLQEYEREMKSYGIPVKEFSVQDLSDIKDIHDRESRHFHSKEKTENRKTFEQLDDLTDDDTHPVSRNDPMFSSLDCELSPSSTSSSKLSRCSSTESTEDSDSMTYQQKKLQRKEKKKVKRHTTANKPRPELYNTPRIPVVSRPYHFKPRFNLSLPAEIPRASSNVFTHSSASSMVFPLPQGLNQLTDSHPISENEKSVKVAREIVPSTERATIHLSRSLSSSSEDEQHWSNVMFDEKVKSEASLSSASPPPRPSSVIKKTASFLQTKVVSGQSFSEVALAEISAKPSKRKVILQERGF